ncbi:cytochrome c3 family protein [Gemmatimonadota bacterium]
MRVFFLSLGLFAVTPQALDSQETMAGYLQEEYSCIMCHTGMRTDFLQGVHSGRGILCTDCHGGDPTRFEEEEAHSSGFSGVIQKSEGVALCLSCHGDIARMRQFALEPVTREEYLVSRHGQGLLLEGDVLAPACSDCHGSHAIFPQTDPRSPVNALRVSETCARCHSDPSHVPSGFPVDQMAEWSQSAHGVALLERRNEQAAHCAACHGSHSALPPGVQEIPNVCGKCHQLVRNAYFAGAHGGMVRGRGEGIGCTACHDNHHTEMPPLAEIGVLCLNCHEAESPPGVTGLQLQEQVTRAESAGELARTALRTLEEAGERIDDEEIRLVAVETHLRELLIQAHTLDPEAVDELARRISSLAMEISERADVVEEHRWERQLLAIPLWLLVLGGVLLALRKRRLLLREALPEPGDGPGEGGSV